MLKEVATKLKGIEKQHKEGEEREKIMVKELEAEKEKEKKARTALQSAQKTIEHLKKELENERGKWRAELEGMMKKKPSPAGEAYKQKKELEEKIRYWKEKAEEGEEMQIQLSTAFQQKMTSMIQKIDEHYDENQQLQLTISSLEARVKETEGKLVQETIAVSDFEGQSVAYLEKQLQLEQEIKKELAEKEEIQQQFVTQLEKFCENLDRSHDEKVQLQDELKGMQKKIIEETKIRLELEKKLAEEQETRNLLETSFIERLQKLTDLMFEEETRGTGMEA